MNPIVSTTWLAQHLNDPGLIILDASFPKITDTAAHQEAAVTIANARFFDLKKRFSDQSSPFPNMVPSAQQFEEQSQQLGIHNTSKIVVFDDKGVYSSPRVWWLFKLMGHDDIAVLDGGLPAWIAEGYAVSPKTSKVYAQGSFKAHFNPDYVITYERVCANIQTPSFLIVDARSEGRFKGTQPEPRKELKSGHMDGAINIPYTEVLNEGKYKSKEALQALFKSHPQEKPFVFSCGSGLTACIVLLASVLAGYTSYGVYDGSWTEWAARQNLKTNS